MPTQSHTYHSGREYKDRFMLIPESELSVYYRPELQWIQMRQPTIPALQIAATGTTPPTVTPVHPICAKRIHRNHKRATPIIWHLAQMICRICMIYSHFHDPDLSMVDRSIPEILNDLAHRVAGRDPHQRICISTVGSVFAQIDPAQPLTTAGRWGTTWSRSWSIWSITLDDLDHDLSDLSP